MSSDAIIVMIDHFEEIQLIQHIWKQDLDHYSWLSGTILGYYEQILHPLHLHTERLRARKHANLISWTMYFMT